MGIIKPSNVRADKSPLVTTPGRSKCWPIVQLFLYGRSHHLRDYEVLKVTEKDWVMPVSAALCAPSVHHRAPDKPPLVMVVFPQQEIAS